jgi:two-component system, OmpR family, response regulator TctD
MRRMSCGLLSYQTAERLLRLQDRPLNLAFKEHVILEIFVMRRGKKEVIHERIYSLDTFVKAVEVYVHRWRRKLADAEIKIVTLRGFGYMLEPAQG